jgi:uncharacterized protein (TIGR02145 family)
MSRNLGAGAADLSTAAYGLYYQWGRKDPFPTTGDPGAEQAGGGAFTAIARTTDIGTVSYSIQHPSEFITFSGDWLVTRQDDLWGQGADKSVYDPCPSGWRVPGFTDGNNPWYGFTAANSSWSDSGGKGRDWSNATYNDGEEKNLLDPQSFAVYPASGYRLYSAGTLGATGSDGYVWSSAVSGADGYCLTFGASSVDPMLSGYRAGGRAVRCVSE